MKRKFILNGLHCSTCAMKIENAIKTHKEFSNVEFHFATSMLIVFTKLSEKESIDIIDEIVKIYEQGVSVTSANDSKFKAEINKPLLLRILISLILFVLALTINISNKINIIVLMLAYFIIGYDILIRSIKDLLGGRLFDENFLMTIATIGAIGINEYHEAVAVMLFYQIGEYLQGIAVNKSRKSISELMDIKAVYANKKDLFNVIKVAPEELEVNDIIIIKPGEKVPVDCKIIDGEGYIDTVQLTGESIPKKVNVGSDILSGFINKENLITAKVMRKYEDSAVSKILDLVENANSKKAETEKFITKFARIYTPVIVVLATLITIIPTFVFKLEFNVWFYRALIFLVISCPCALVVSVPLGFFNGIGLSSKEGILVKGGNYLEALNTVETVVFDKTGTLTEGKFKVNEIKVYNGVSEEELIKYASLSEMFSNHPIADAIKEKYYGELNNNIIDIHTDIPGRGVKALIDGKEVLVGNYKLLIEEKIEVEELDLDSTIIYVSIDSVFAGYFLISDKIKNEAKELIDYLQNEKNMDIYMLTGDNEVAAKRVATSLNISNYYSELLPNDKVKKISNIMNENSTKIIFVGDGTNDAPVLKMADIGISMGSMGSDAAIEASDVVIMNDDILKIKKVLKISKRTRKIVIQNIVFALTTKIIILLLGVIGLASMKAAIFADVGVALLAILNSFRISNY